MNGSDRMGMDKRKYFLLKTVIFLFMLAAALIALFPFYWMFVTAVKPIDEIFAFPPKLWPGEFIWSNFATALSRAPFGLYFRNSFIVTTLSTLITVCINLLAGFAFAKYKFPGKTVLFYFVIATMLVPPEVGSVPLFIIMKKVGLINSLWSLVIPRIATAVGIFYMNQ